MHNEHKDKLISFYRREKRMPTYTEMMALFGFKSKNAVARLVDKFIDAGIVAKDHLGRLVAENSFDTIPLLGSVKAGFPSDVAEEMHDTVNIDTYLIDENKKAKTYMLEVDGDSMIDAHIADGDMVLVEKTDRARDGDIVVANVDGEFTMKYFKKSGDKVWLEPANRSFKPIHPKQYLTINGIVTAVIRKI
jgi:SOS regulatory protein LexA